MWFYAEKNCIDQQGSEINRKLVTNIWQIVRRLVNMGWPLLHVFMIFFPVVKDKNYKFCVEIVILMFSTCI